MQKEKTKEEVCCVVECERPLDQKFWDAQYVSKNTGWDLGEVSPPLKVLIDNLENKNQKILIPGAGNAYEAAYLMERGFADVTVVDIAPTVIAKLNEQFLGNPFIKVIEADFFEHEGEYDLIIEQTFFCALPPFLRQKYVWKMHRLLKENGVLSGLLFNRDFDVSPPFGGSKTEYEKLFQSAFQLEQLESCNNSVKPRAGSELFFSFKKNVNTIVALYEFNGITCNGCMKSVTEKFMALENVLNVSISSNFSHVLIVSNKPLSLETLQQAIAYDAKYSIDLIA